MTKEERETRIADLKKRQDFFYDKDIALLIELLEQEKTGHWIYRKGYVPYKWKCDKCFASSKTDFNYCPNCGAKMEVER